jgi:hypothetical protein
VTTTQPLETEAGPTARAEDADAPAVPGTPGTSGTPTAPGTSGARPANKRFAGLRRLKIGPILPERLRPVKGVPPVWLEILFIGVSYSLYTLTRLAAPAHETAAENRGWDLLHIEHYLGLNFEHSFNHWVFHITWLAFAMNVYYATLHFVVTVGVLIWVYMRHPDHYRAVRTVMFAMTGLALIGFYFYSLAPPRLLHGGDFIDTFKLLNPWGQSASTSDGVAGMTATNQYAAMPSLHIGWSTWCALTIAHLARRWWVKALGIAYPFLTFAVIIGTGNHYVLDAVGGLIVLAAGFFVARLLLGRPVYAASGDSGTDAGAEGGTGGPARGLPQQADVTEGGTRKVSV